jgi:hypothetical protein
MNGPAPAAHRGRRTHRRRIGAGVALAVALGTAGLLGAGCGSPSSAPKPTGPAPGAVATGNAIEAAVVGYLDREGVAHNRYVLENTVSAVDPTWARFVIEPTAAAAATLQGGYGFVEKTSSGWKVVDLGSAEVGCPVGSDSTPDGPATVPAKVLAGFGLSCPRPLRPLQPLRSTPATTTTTG